MYPPPHMTHMYPPPQYYRVLRAPASMSALVLQYEVYNWKNSRVFLRGKNQAVFKPLQKTNCLKRFVSLLFLDIAGRDKTVCLIRQPVRASGGYGGGGGGGGGGRGDEGGGGSGGEDENGGGEDLCSEIHKGHCPMVSVPQVAVCVCVCVSTDQLSQYVQTKGQSD